MNFHYTTFNFVSYCFDDAGQKKLGKVICPDPWKSGARNTTGKKNYYILRTSIRPINDRVSTNKRGVEHLVQVGRQYDFPDLCRYFLTEIALFAFPFNF